MQHPCKLLGTIIFLKLIVLARLTELEIVTLWSANVSFGFLASKIEEC